MQNKIIYLALLISILAYQSCKKEEAKPAEFVGFQTPSQFPASNYPFQSNPVTENGFLLGKKLFYDGILSRDGSISCGSCHIQYSAFTHHGHRTSHGIDDLLGTRNAPAIQNMGWNRHFFWDGGVHNLDMLSFAPIENPVEMDETVTNVLNKLRNHPEYPRLFEAAFGSPEINTARMMQALSQFMLMLISANSRYDQFMNGKTDALSAEEQQGLGLFRQKCASCHQEPLFMDNDFHYNGIFRTNDLGRWAITLNPSDSFRFKTPSLRNVGYTQPYMHNGLMASLDDVLNHYQSGIYDHQNLAPTLRGGIAMSEAEKAQIKAFLLSLNDEEFVRNPLFSE